MRPKPQQNRFKSTLPHTTGSKNTRRVRLQRYGEGVLDFADDEDAVEGADAVKVA